MAYIRPFCWPCLSGSPTRGQRSPQDELTALGSCEQYHGMPLITVWWWTISWTRGENGFKILSGMTYKFIFKSCILPWFWLKFITFESWEHLNSLIPKRCVTNCNSKCVIFKHISNSDQYLRHLQWDCTQVDARVPQWWLTWMVPRKCSNTFQNIIF